MKRVFIIAVLFSVLSVWAEEEPAVAEIYKNACALRDQGKFAEAIEEVSKGIALNPMERDWLAKSELLSAELYLKMGVLESAQTVARQVALLYNETEFEAEAKRLQEEIKQLIEQSKETDEQSKETE